MNIATIALKAFEDADKVYRSRPVGFSFTDRVCYKLLSAAAALANGKNTAAVLGYVHSVAADLRNGESL